MELPRRLFFMLLAGGVFVCFSVMAIAQEKVFKTDYEGENFLFPISFAAMQCFCFAIVAGALSLTRDCQVKSDVPQKYYVFVAVFYVASMVLSNFALQYLSFPAKVIAKSCKPISVMIIGTIITKKVYTVQKYIFVIMLVAGISLFAYADGKDHKEKEVIVIGYVILAVALLMDGFLGAAEDLLRKVSKPSAIHFMFFLNAWSSPVVMILLLCSGEILPFVQFCIKYPAVNVYLGVVVVVGCLGQYFMSSLITNFGALPLSITMTLRKFFTVLFSVFYFNNYFNYVQWIAAVVIFVALTLNVFFGKKKKVCDEDQVKEEENKENTSNV